MLNLEIFTLIWKSGLHGKLNQLKQVLSGKLLSILVMCVHKKVLLNDLSFSPKPTVPYINISLSYILKCGGSTGGDIKFPA